MAGSNINPAVKNQIEGDNTNNYLLGTSPQIIQGPNGPVFQSGNDAMYGYGGHDSLYGLGGSDHLFGSFGNDKLYGGDGNDDLDGGSGEDSLYGGAGDDELIGGLNNDWLYAGTGSDELIGGSGNDYLDGYGNTESEYDTLTGGSDADKFVLGNAGRFTPYYLGNGYATITDFSRLQGDKIQLVDAGLGDKNNYSLGTNNWGGTSALDTGIFYKGNLIGVVHDVTNMSFASDFTFVPYVVP